MKYRPSILILANFFLPGCRGGGPPRHLVQLMQQLEKDFEFSVITTNRDVHSPYPYPGIIPGKWQKLGQANVLYLRANIWFANALIKALRSNQYDAIYLISVFNPAFTILPLTLRKFHLVRQSPILIQPNGDLAEGSLSVRTFKKRCYLALARKFGLYRDAIWKACTRYEEGCIHREFTSATVYVAPDLVEIEAGTVEPPTRPWKRSGELRIVFLSRICPVKNLLYALHRIAELRGDVRFDVYGPIEDKAYWNACRQLMGQLPNTILANYQGVVPHDQVVPILSQYHVLFLPTLGESFGQVIVEAFRAGCPVILSNRTPWRDLESKHIGWDLDLADPEQFQLTLQKCVDMDAEGFHLYSLSAWQFAQSYARDPMPCQLNRMFLHQAMAVSQERVASVK